MRKNILKTVMLWMGMSGAMLAAQAQDDAPHYQAKEERAKDRIPYGSFSQAAFVRAARDTTLKKGDPVLEVYRLYGSHELVVVTSVNKKEAEKPLHNPVTYLGQELGFGRVIPEAEDALFITQDMLKAYLRRNSGDVSNYNDVINIAKAYHPKGKFYHPPLEGTPPLNIATPEVDVVENLFGDSLKKKRNYVLVTGL